MREEEFQKLLQSSEKKRVEFKGRVNFKDFKEHFAVTLISMGNIIGGGIIIIGVNDKSPRVIDGLIEDELRSFDKTTICNYLQNKVSPMPDFESELFLTQDKNILIFYVKEFSDVPHIVTNQIVLKKYRKYKPGDILIRTESAQSRRIQNENEMRELISLSMRKRSELLLSDIKSIITGKVEKVEENPNEIFNKSIIEFEEPASDFKKINEGLVYWKFQFVPLPLVNREIDLRKHFEKSVITRNGDSFPTFFGIRDNAKIIHSSLSLINDEENWRLSKGLCFGMYRGVWHEIIAQSAQFNYPPPPNRPLSLELLIIDLLDFFTFCKNLVSEEVIDSVWINVELLNTKNRYLGSYSNPFRMRSQNLVCLSDQIKMEEIIARGDLLSSYKDIGIKYIFDIFENFQQQNLTKDYILQIYTKYLKGQ